MAVRSPQEENLREYQENRACSDLIAYPFSTKAASSTPPVALALAENFHWARGVTTTRITNGTPRVGGAIGYG